MYWSTLSGGDHPYCPRPPTPGSGRSNETLIHPLLCGRDRRGSFEFKLSYSHLAHLELLRLARDCHRKALDDLPESRNFVVRDLAGAESAEVIAGGRFTLFQDNPGHDLLAIL